MPVSNEPYCMNCLQPFRDVHPCPRCGYRNILSSVDFCERTGTILAGQYLIGRCLSKTSRQRVYRALEIGTQALVTVVQQHTGDEPMIASTPVASNPARQTIASHGFTSRTVRGGVLMQTILENGQRFAIYRPWLSMAWGRKQYRSLALTMFLLCGVGVVGWLLLSISGSSQPVTLHSDALGQAILTKFDADSLTVGLCEQVRHIQVLGDKIVINGKNPSTWPDAAAQTTPFDIGDMSNFPNLQTLWVDNRTLDGSLELLKACVQLDMLSMVHVPVESLRPLQGITWLKRLELYDCNISDLSPLTSLPLERLILSYNALCDLSPLAGMDKLKALSLSGNINVQDLSVLAKLSTLLKLDMQDMNLTGVTPLAALQSLTYLSLADNPSLRDISPLYGLKNLDTLDLTGTQVAIDDNMSFVEDLIWPSRASHDTVKDRLAVSAPVLHAATAA